MKIMANVANQNETANGGRRPLKMMAVRVIEIFGCVVTINMFHHGK